MTRRYARLVCSLVALVGIIGEAALTFATPDRSWTNTLEFLTFGTLAVLALMTLLALNTSD